MIFKDKIVKLKNEKECILRNPDAYDAEKLIEYLKQISSETDYMIRYPEEINMTIKEEEKILKDIKESDNSIMISAFIDDKLVGNTSINVVGDKIKAAHRAAFGIAIIKEAWGLGIGTTLITEVLEFAKRAGFEQVELEVVTVNYKAINLYERFGFKKYGTRENAFKLKDGSYCSEHLMMKVL